MHNDSVTRLIESAWEQPGRLQEVEKFRRDLAVMFTDIKGSTAYFEKYGDAAGLAMVHRCNQTLRQSVEEHGGTVVKTIGDAIMATFADGQSSVRAAVRMQKALIAFNSAKARADHVFIRIGINYGPAIVRSNNDVFGDAVNVAARLESLAQPQQIVISDNLRQQLTALTEFETAYLGRYRLKGKSGDCDVYEVVWNNKRVALPQTTCLRIPTPGCSAPTVYALIHVRQDGSDGETCEIGSQPVVVGRTNGSRQFPADSALAPAHAQLSLKDGQIEVEPLSQSAEVYVQLVGPYCLQDADQVMMGSHVFELQNHQDQPLDSASKFVLVRGEAGPEQRAVSLSECTIWGRSIGTCTFPGDKIMSRSHAKIYRRGNDFFIEDLGSRNGTFLRVRGSAIVAPGSAVLMGSQRFRVEPR
jgi:class 3 adenylate cyclase